MDLGKALASLFGSANKAFITSFLSTVVLLGGLLTFADGYERWDNTGLFTPASRGWVRATKTSQVTNLELTIARANKEAAEGRLDVLELDYLKQATDEGRVLNRQKQRKERETIDQIKAQIRAIESEKK